MAETFADRLAADVSADVSADLREDGDLDITSWTDLAGLPDDMDELAAQLTSIVRHARTWVCQSAGFEPSRICLLRPLAQMMDALASGFGDLEQVGLDDWVAMREAVVGTSADLKAIDAWVADRLPVVA